MKVTCYHGVGYIRPPFGMESYYCIPADVSSVEIGGNYAFAGHSIARLRALRRRKSSSA